MPKIVDEEQILNAAADMLTEVGYDGATTRAIAEAAGVNEVTLFRRFGSKTALFERAIAHRLAETPLNRVSYTGDLESDLLAVAGAYLETNETHGNIVAVILIEAPRSPDLRGLLQTPWKNLQTIVRLLERYQRRGLLRREPPLAALAALIGPIMVTQMFLMADLGLPVPPVDLQRHIAAFLDGRRPRGRRPQDPPLLG